MIVDVSGGGARAGSDPGVDVGVAAWGRTGTATGVLVGPAGTGAGVSVGLGTRAGVGVQVAAGAGVGEGVGDGDGVGDGVAVGVAVGAGLKVKTALAFRDTGGPTEGQATLAETITCTCWPGLPWTVNVPFSVPSRLIEAEPETPMPRTAALPTGALPEAQTQPAPLKRPLTDGAAPVDGSSVRLGASADADWAETSVRTTATAMRRAERIGHNDDSLIEPAERLLSQRPRLFRADVTTDNHVDSASQDV
ncbi:MAG: hypothetical protein GEU75_07525 [Dehalococcoidia bacterium]|nr:hypothetical protein [Dehalococcoidia bacterium]